MTQYQLSKKHYLGLLLVVLLTYCFGRWYWIRTSGGNQGTDAAHYFQLAVSLIEQGQFDYSNKPDFPPLYPAFLAFIFLISGGPSTVTASIANVILFGCIAGLVGWTGMRFYGPLAGYIGAAMVAINPNLLFMANLPQSEMLFTILLLLLALSLHSYAQKQSVKWLIVSGILAGLAALTRSALYIYIPVILVWIYIIYSGTPVARFKQVLSFFVVILLPIVLWSMWLSQTRGGGASGYGALALHLGNHEAYYIALKDYLFGSGFSWLQIRDPGGNLTDLQRLSEIWGFISASPLEWIHLYFLKLHYHLQFYNLKDIPFLRIAIWSSGYWLVIWPLVIVYLLKNRPAWFSAFVWIIGANLLLHPIIHTARYHRYRVPIEPLLVLLAVGGFSYLKPIVSMYTYHAWVKVRN